jgi:two-component system, OmpR family, phosphate regulon response regulator PhoB
MKPHRILIVEDDPNISELITITLDFPFYAITCVDSGAAALAKLAEEKPDLVVLDILIPEPDGWKLYKFIRNDPSLADTRILILTALITKQDGIKKSKILPTDGYMTKPFNLDELKMKVMELLKCQAVHEHEDFSQPCPL